MRLAEEVAMLDHLSRGWVACGPGIGVLEHEFLRWKLPFYERREMSRGGPGDHCEGVDRGERHL